MKNSKKVLILLLSVLFLFFVFAAPTFASNIIGDLNNDGVLNRKDAVYLLYHTFLPVDFPVEQTVDYNGDGVVTDRDVLKLLVGDLGEVGNTTQSGSSGPVIPAPDNDTTIPTIGPVEFPTNFNSPRNAETVAVRTEEEQIGIHEAASFTVSLSNSPAFTSAMIEVEVSSGLKLASASIKSLGKISDFNKTIQKGVLLFENPTSLNEDVLTLGINTEASGSSFVTVTVTYHDADCNVVATSSATCEFFVQDPEPQPGDINRDGTVDSADGLLLLRHLNGWKNLDIADESAMDVNADGTVNMVDGLILMRYLNGWEIELGGTL